MNDLADQPLLVGVRVTVVMTVAMAIVVAVTLVRMTFALMSIHPLGRMVVLVIAWAMVGMRVSHMAQDARPAIA